MKKIELKLINIEINVNRNQFGLISGIISLYLILKFIEIVS